MKILCRLGPQVIVGINGRLRVVDTKKRPCQGYAMGCQCRACRDKENYLKRKALNLDAKKASRCECGGQALGGDDRTCYKCGKAVSRAA